jgi:hypothetical protein
MSEMPSTTKNAIVSNDNALSLFNRQFLRISKYSDSETDAMGDLSTISPDQLTELQNAKSMESLGLKNGNRIMEAQMKDLQKRS